MMDKKTFDEMDKGFKGAIQNIIDCVNSEDFNANAAMMGARLVNASKNGKGRVSLEFDAPRVIVDMSGNEGALIIAMQQLIEHFGEECYDADGLNRAYLAGCVFGDAEALQRLNGIVHPAVREDFRCWAEQQHSAYVVFESAILFEAGFETEVDATLAVLAPREMRIQRTMQRDGITREAVEQRISHQMSDEELHAMANRTLVNLRQDYLESDIEQLHKMFLYEAHQSH
jgi:dephospho-CoA kinase